MEKKCNKCKKIIETKKIIIPYVIIKDTNKCKTKCLKCFMQDIEKQLKKDLIEKIKKL